MAVRFFKNCDTETGVQSQSVNGPIKTGITLPSTIKMQVRYKDIYSPPCACILRDCPSDLQPRNLLQRTTWVFTKSH
jgi:hypothetical protein